MSDSSEPQSPSTADTPEKAPSQQQNSLQDKRLALELSQHTATQSIPHNLMLLGSADSSVEAAVTSMAAVVQAVQKQQHLTGQQQLALAVQAAHQTSISSSQASSVSFKSFFIVLVFDR